MYIHSHVARTCFCTWRVHSYICTSPCVSHTRMGQVSVKKVFAFVSFLSISLSLVSCLTHLLLSPYDSLTLSRLSYLSSKRRACASPHEVPEVWLSGQVRAQHMILGKAGGGEFRREITAATRKSYVPTRDRLQKARILADSIRRMCDADLECRRLAPAWKLVTTVSNNALFLDCCVVPPGALGFVRTGT